MAAPTQQAMQSMTIMWVALSSQYAHILVWLGGRQYGARIKVGRDTSLFW
jgi:hypothetical protein